MTAIFKNMVQNKKIAMDICPEMRPTHPQFYFFPKQIN